MIKQTAALLADLEKLRTKFNDPGDKGSGAEESFRQLLVEYLPRSHGVGHGEIVDSAGGQSGQLDAVAAGPDHPATFSTVGGPGIFILEAVTAVAQVKAVLNSTELKKAVKNCESVKQLSPNTEAVGARWTSGYNLTHSSGMPPFFLVAFGSSLKLKTVVDRAESLDAVFLLDRGVGLRSVEGGWPMLSGDELVVDGWVMAERPDEVLGVLFAWLNLVMPRPEFQASPLGPYLT